MAATGIVAIDALLAGSSDVALEAGNCDAETASFLQDLLIGHGFGNLPGILGTGRGRFGPHTSSAIRQFQQAQSLPITGTVDRTTLRALVDSEWPRPFACCAYLTLVLDVAFIGTTRLVSLTSQFEGAGLFTALNRNTDRAGLSFGLIQWAQRPGRLHELLRAFRAANSELFAEIFGNGDQAVAQALLEHTVKVRGGTDANGRTIDPRFDLISPPWDSRFIEAGRHRELQVVQLDTAVADFQRSLSRLRLFAPQIQTEHGIAFMLDAANQHGDGGLEDIVRTVHAPGLSEADLLAAVEHESVARVRARFGDGNEVTSTRFRRETFRTSELLSDETVATT